MSAQARRRVSARDLDWADRVLCMEAAHRDRALRVDGSAETRAKLRVLDIPDDYRRDDPELVAMLRAQVDALLEGAR